MLNKLSSIYETVKPTVQGAGGLTLMQITPTHTGVEAVPGSGLDSGQVMNVVVGLVTIITQIIHLFKRKRRPENGTI